jgi:hypothetical protein
VRRFGHRFDDRSLWSRRVREAEEVSDVLRDAGLVESSGEPHYYDGFVVEGGDDGAPFAVAARSTMRQPRRAEVLRYTDALRAGECGCSPTPDDAQCLEVWPPTDQDPSWWDSVSVLVTSTAENNGESYRAGRRPIPVEPHRHHRPSSNSVSRHNLIAERILGMPKAR